MGLESPLPLLPQGINVETGIQEKKGFACLSTQRTKSGSPSLLHLTQECTGKALLFGKRDFGSFACAVFLAAFKQVGSKYLNCFFLSSWPHPFIGTRRAPAEAHCSLDVAREPRRQCWVDPIAAQLGLVGRLLVVLLGNLGNWRGHRLGFWATKINSLLHHTANHHYAQFQRPAASSMVKA